MCRIVGYWDFNKRHTSHISEMKNQMIHGGPDDHGEYIEQDSNLEFGHRRLSIIDLSNMAHQPMIIQNHIIIFNGEIYNYKEIRNELSILGYKFNSNSDTEVILNSYIQWGEKCVRKFDGIWSFAIRDRTNNTIFLSRDRNGVKPLYWYFDDNIFMFSSELKALSVHPKFNNTIDKNSLKEFFRYGYIGKSHSIFNNCFKLEAATNLIIDHKKNIKITPYFNREKSFINKIDYTENEILEKAKKHLTKSILSRTVSDVKFGVFLSGGNDSSLVSAILKENQYDFETFTIGFDEAKYNESTIAKKISNHLSIKNNSFLCNISEAKDIIPKIPLIYDEPFGDSSAIPMLLLSKFTSNFVKVALSSDGGDEQFYGYNRYLLTNNRYKYYKYKHNKLFYNILNQFQNKTILKIINSIHSPNISLEKYLRIKQSLKENTFENIYKSDLSIFKEEELVQLTNNRYQEEADFKNILDFNTNMQCFDLIHYLTDDILVKTDRASMNFGLEVRDPLLQSELIEFSSSIPMKYKYKNLQKKYILKELLKQYLPSDIINLPKKGFSVPLFQWFNSDQYLKELLCDELSSDSLKNDLNINYSYVQKLLKSFLHGNSVVIYKLWLILMYKLWKDQWAKIY